MRRKLSHGYNKSHFRKTADRTKAINVIPTLMRGGYRL